MTSVVLIDGRSGSGKTTHAALLAAELGAHGVPAQTLHLDSLYPGWNGLSRGSAAVATVLRERGYYPYDWALARFSEKRITLDPLQPLVIEGCGALTAENLDAARDWAGPGEQVRSLWLECDEAVRRERALARDGEMFAPHWDEWAGQESAHYELHEPWLLADEVLRI